ncbi:MAG: MAPEG family protein [Gammaproteobacteria bacterium]|nr:MAPEG family protein [Gammaproteobacteria bacterium]
MNTSLTIEIYWLIATLLMTSLFWLPYILNRMLEQGIVNALWDPLGDTRTEKPWANRMMQAHNNAVENLVIFAPLAILVQITGTNSTMTANACMIYFISRLLHYSAFTFAIPLLRVITFLCGFGAQLTLGISLLSA